MTADDIEKVMGALNGVHGACYVCAALAARDLTQQFPYYRMLIQRCYTEEFGMALPQIAGEFSHERGSG